MTNPAVGTLYEVAINDVGYMLADVPDSQVEYRRVVSTMEPERFASGETPISESIERYSYFNSSEWRGGAGQRFLNRGDSDRSSYWDSEGVDPFQLDQRLHLLPAVDLKQASAVADAMAVAGSQYLLLRDTGLVEQHTISGDTVTGGNTHSIATVTDMDIGYGKGFIATGTDLIEITLGGSGETTRSTLDVHRVAWIGDRLAVLYRDSATSTWRFSTLDSAGTEEVAGGLLTLPGATNASMASCAYRLGGITGGIGYVWFSSWTADGDEGYIYVWNVDTTLSPSIAAKMPRGEIPLDILFYQGGLYVWSVAANEGVVRIWRAVVNGDGTLTPFVVVDEAGDAPSSLLYDGRKFAATGRFVYFAWNGMQANSGLGVIDLDTGGFAKRTHGTATGDVVSAVVWGNRPGLSVASRGLMLEHSTNKVTTGWLRTSLADADSALDKHWDSLSFNADQATGTTASVAYTTDGGSSYTTLISASTATKTEVALGVESPSLGLQFTLVGNGSTEPLFRVGSAKFHPIGILDTILVLPVDCSDNREGLNGHDLGYTKGSGIARARALAALQGNFVTVQDIDWRETSATYSMEVVSVDFRRMRAAYDPAYGANRTWQVAVVTLRSTTLKTAATAPSNTAPVISNPGAQVGTAGTPLTLQVTATDADSDSLAWGAKNLPAGLVMDQNGRISGTPTTAGASTVTVVVTDPYGGSDSETFSWTIS